MSSVRMAICGCFSSTRANPRIVSSSQTAPVGLEGLPRITALVRGVIAFSRASGRGTHPCSPAHSSGTAVAPASLTMSG